MTLNVEWQLWWCLRRMLLLMIRIAQIISSLSIHSCPQSSSLTLSLSSPSSCLPANSSSPSLLPHAHTHVCLKSTHTVLWVKVMCASVASIRLAVRQRDPTVCVCNDWPNTHTPVVTLCANTLSHNSLTWIWPLTCPLLLLHKSQPVKPTSIHLSIYLSIYVANYKVCLNDLKLILVKSAHLFRSVSVCVCICVSVFQCVFGLFHRETSSCYLLCSCEQCVCVCILHVRALY